MFSKVCACWVYNPLESLSLQSFKTVNEVIYFFTTSTYNYDKLLPYIRMLQKKIYVCFNLEPLQTYLPCSASIHLHFIKDMAFSLCKLNYNYERKVLFSFIL